MSEGNYQKRKQALIDEMFPIGSRWKTYNGDICVRRDPPDDGGDYAGEIWFEWEDVPMGVRAFHAAESLLDSLERAYLTPADIPESSRWDLINPRDAHEYMPQKIFVYGVYKRNISDEPDVLYAERECGLKTLYTLPISRFERYYRRYR